LFSLPKVNQWLSERGLELSTEKTKLVHIDEGFDFLGFNVRRYDGKLLIKPQKEKVLAFCKRIGETIKKMATVKQEVLIKKLNPILHDIENLIHLHSACHKQEHSKTKFKAGSMA
jgi:RNA-directed DNA polymerase